MKTLIDKLEKEHSLSLNEYQTLIEGHCPSLQAYAAQKAVAQRMKVYGRDVYVRGLIEISNICKNNCYYCGIRAQNSTCERYRLTKPQILECCKAGYDLGFRTFVLQGGEDGYYTDRVMEDIVFSIKNLYPDCAITLSLGEKERESYKRLFDAGADRYLLRHETADAAHYAFLHPKELTLENRVRCLNDLKDLGFQVGCGFMVGSPRQSAAHLASDMKFVEEFSPHMVGIGPFIAHHATPFAKEKSGSVDMTLYLLSLLRLQNSSLLLPATTALGTLQKEGREKGILAGANVVMPNLSPKDARKKYELYNEKISVGAEAAENIADLKRRMNAIGYRVVSDRGDWKNEKL